MPSGETSENRPSFDRARGIAIVALVVAYAASGRPGHLTVPFLVWAAFRHAPPGAATAILAAAALAVGTAIHGAGPFPGAALNVSRPDLPEFLLIAAPTVLALITAVTERRRAETAMRRAYEGSEERVRAGTADLAAANADRRQAESALRGSEERYRSLVQAIPDIVYQIDPDGRFTFVNEAIRWYGYEPDELIGAHFSTILHAEDVPAVSRSSVLLVYAGRTTGEADAPKLFDERRTGARATRNLEVRVLCRGRDEVRIGSLYSRGEVYASGQYAEASGAEERRFLGTVGIIRDITGSKQAEKKFRGLLESAPDAMVICNPKGEVVLVNAWTERLFGYPREELLGRPVEILIPDRFPGSPGPHRDEYFGETRIRRLGTSRELHGRRRDGSEFPAEIRLSPIETEEGVLVSAAIRDITDRRQAETALRRAHEELEARVRERTEELSAANANLRRESVERGRIDAALRESEERYRIVAETASDAILTIDESSVILYANRAVDDIFGYPPESLVGRKLSLLMPEHQWNRHAADIRAYLETGRRNFPGKSVELSGVHRNGQEVPLEISFGEFVKEGRRYFVGTVRDVSHRRRNERMKNEFVATVSHELRTPLTAIHGSLGLIAGGLAGELTPKTRALVETALKNSDRLVRLVNDILDVERLELGQTVIRPTVLDLVDLVKQSIEINRPYGAKYSVRFDLRHDGADVRVTADGDRLTQVMTNLLSNAAKFSPPEGTVAVEVARRSGGTVRVSVADRGPGVPEEIRGQIFQKFVRGDSGRTGSGLGLSIAKTIIDRHGGRIGFEPTPGGGATFYFDLPCASPPLAPAAPKPSARQSRAGGGATRRRKEHEESRKD